VPVDEVLELRTAPRAVLDRLRRRPGDPALMALLMCLAAVLRLPNIDRAYWVDEGISIGIASHRLSAIPGLLHRDGSPPLFYVLLHFWLKVFGTGEVETHLLPLLSSLALIPVAWWCGRTLFGATAGRYAALLAATNPFLNWYSTETRMYPLVVGLSLVGVTLAVRAFRSHRARDAVWAAVCFTALVYTHDWGLYVVAATAAVLGVTAMRDRDWRAAAFVVGGAVVVALLYLPWIPTFVYQAHNTAAPWAVRPSLGDLIADPSSILGGTLGVVVVPLFVVGLIYVWWRGIGADNRAVDLMGAIGLLTVACGWVLAQIEPSWTSRYLAVALGPLLMAIVGSLTADGVGRRIMVAAVAMLVAWSVVGSLLPDANARYAKSNVAAVVHVARRFMGPGDLVIVTQTEQTAVVAHYLPSGPWYATPTGLVADPHVVDWRDLVKRLAAADPCKTIGPELDALSIGAHIFVVNPLKRVGASGSNWSTTVNDKVDAVNELLLDDPALTEIGFFGPATSPKPFSAVTGLLFVKKAGPPTCSS
jgi:hypothetical protein